ncbi:hypothetical protein TWF730_003342 [Orbilia blumenaviensis]|uniref:Uncharacterized protein n=1 Tax=Orbilia blumenaviensis TaxID=1796055 RepID=A0AAV9U925_9PEZI
MALGTKRWLLTQNIYITIPFIISLLTTQIPSTAALDEGKIWDQTLPLLSRVCKLGLYTKPNHGIWFGNIFHPVSSWYGAWEGFPLGDTYDPDTSNETLSTEYTRATCHNIEEEIGGKLVQTGMKQLYVSGYCFCLFYRNKGCVDDSPMVGRNVVANRLPYGWENEVRSFKCQKYSNWDVFTGCDINYSNTYREGEKQIPPDGEKGIYHAKRFEQKDFDEWTGKGKCMTVDPVTLVQWSIKGCTCSFYTDTECKANALVDGHMGLVEREEIKDLMGLKILSYRCDIPYTSGIIVPNSYFEIGDPEPLKSP